ncbi:MAG TPA: TIGR02677 family protein [Ktedonobacteraceae bacterium]|nr:TIGR02677 family protein [Ktedonobacteraceae bacterium]
MINTVESVVSASVFNLTDRLPIFSYLVTPNRVHWYRVIMRAFFQRHRELYRYQLTAQEVRDAVRDAFDPAYTLEQCQNDLAALKEWGNITTIYDSSRATSIASFLSPALLYQATPEAIAIETFLAEQARASAASGSLRQSDLPRLWQSLQFIDESLHLPSNELILQRGREVAEEWQRAFEIWDTMAREAAQYLATMINAAQQTRPELEVFQAYKAAVVAYVHGFAQALTQYGSRIRGQIAQWNATDKLDLFITLVAEHLDPPDPTMENARTEEERLQDARNQLDALANWFAQGQNADSFRRNALAEVDKVVRRAAALASAARPNANYAVHLNTLARQLLQARDGETAQQIFSVAFGNLLPVHLPEGVAGSPSTIDEHEQSNPWKETPDATVHLRPVSRSYRGDPPLEDPIIDHRSIINEMIMLHEQKLQKQRECFAHLFAHPYLDIGTIETITPEDRAALMEIIDSCLGHDSHQYRALNGSTVVLLNPNETTYTLLQGTDGILFLPRYRLQELSPEPTTVDMVTSQS